MRFRLANRSVSVIALSAILSIAVVLYTVAFVPVEAHADDGNVITDNSVTSSDIQEAVNTVASVTPALVAASVDSVETPTSVSVSTTASGSTVQIPRNPGAGLSISTPGAGEIGIELPNAEFAQTAVQTDDGQVTYPSAASSASAAIPTDTGVQLLNVIANSSAPTRYDYRISLPTGARLFLTEDGGAQVDDASGNVLSVVMPAWAKDANGVDIPTHFETDGVTLTQVVDHIALDGVAYPVVADPNWWQAAIAVAVGVAVGTAVAVTIKIPSLGWFIGGCVTGALNAVFDGKNFWGVFNGCMVSGILSVLGGTIRNLVIKFLASRGFKE